MALIVLTCLVLATLSLMQRAWLRRQSWRVWGEALSLRRDLSLRSYADSVEERLSVFELACRQARRAHEAEAADQAHDLLATARRLGETFVPQLCARLRLWSEVAAALRAAAPVEPLAPGRLRLAELRGLARLEGLARAFLLSAVAHLRLHLLVLRWGLRLGLRALRALRLPPRPSAWPRLDDACTDVGTLARDSVRAYATLLVSAQPALAHLELLI